MNKVYLIGNLTKDPETAVNASGKSRTIFTVATNRKPTSSGEKVTDFHRVVTFGSLADNCARYLAKGRKTAVVGELRYSIYDGSDGIKRTSAEIIANDVEFIDRAPVQEKLQERLDPQELEDYKGDLPF